ncbi:MAG TPA: hypothetical protein VJL31_17625 [Gemmatimonadales bacterium]|nr:hypothetical protein [Gemmatimonadales bacterium]
MRRPRFIAVYLAAGLILATPLAALAQHMGQQHQMGQQDHTQDLMRRMNAMMESMRQKNADLASRVERTQGPMREHLEMMLRTGQAMEQMAAQMRTMMEPMQGMAHQADIVTDQELLRAMNQFHEHLSNMMRQMEGPMRALHQSHGSMGSRIPDR